MSSAIILNAAAANLFWSAAAGGVAVLELELELGLEPRLGGGRVGPGEGNSLLGFRAFGGGTAGCCLTGCF